MGDSDQRDVFDVEPDEGFDGAPAAGTKLKRLRDELKETQKKRDEYLDGWQRCKADSINARKDALQEADRRAARFKETLLEDLLPILDSFDMAMGSEAWVSVADGWKSGMEQVRNQMLELLSRNHIERLGKMGEQFDPRVHEALQEVDDVAGEAHSIIKIVRFGYRSGEKIIRPAQVIIKSA